jgi:hypothetical protein
VIPAPKEDELSFLEDEIRRRTAVALSELRLNPPEARPSRENCAYCTVRQLCEEYWKWITREEGDPESAENNFADLQISLSNPHGPTSWNGVVEASSAIKSGWPILLRASKTPYELHADQRLRILNAKVSIYQEEQGTAPDFPQVVATVGSSTELFLIKSGTNLWSTVKKEN